MIVRRPALNRGGPLILVLDSATFKDAHRSVAQLTIGDLEEITVGQLKAIISPEVIPFSVCSPLREKRPTAKAQRD
jgi:hypothetical protein